MQTFLIIARDLDETETELESIKKQLRVTSWNTHLIIPSPSIGIAEIRKIKHLVSLKPMGEANRLIVISEMDKATVEAQNALLKILEEPPVNTYLVLTVKNPNNLLPTVVSRCQTVSKGSYGKAKVIPENHDEEILNQILKKGPGERIIYVSESIKTKEDAAVFLDKILKILKDLLIRQKPHNCLSKKEAARLLSKVSAAQKYLARNVNYKATIDVLLLGFPAL